MFMLVEDHHMNP